MVPRLGQDFDNVAAVQLVTQRNHASVDLGAYTGMANFGVDGVSEVHRCSVSRQDQDLPFRSKRVDLLRVEVNLESIQKLAGIRYISLPLHHLAKPGESLLVAGGDG